MSDSFLCRRSGNRDNGYVTINFESGASHVEHSVPTPLSEARIALAATEVGDYALFGGGEVNNSPYHSSTVDAYNESLTRTTPTSLSEGRNALAATTVGDYALFGGGHSGSALTNVVDAYNLSLTRSTPTSLSEARRALAATTVGNYALFGGGWSGFGYSQTIDAYNSNLVRSTPTSLSEGRQDLASTSVEGYDANYALFGGGRHNSTGDYYSYSTVDAYNTSLTRSTPTSLSQARGCLAATSVRTYYVKLTPIGTWIYEYYALFAGGYTDDNYFVYPTVDAYNKSLTRSTPTPLSESRYYLSAARVGNLALFGGGYGNSYSSTVDAYDENFVRYTASNLSEGRELLSAATVGNYALFGGGYVGSGFSSTVDAYTINSKVQVYPGTIYKFNDMQNEQTSSTFQELTLKTPISGYMKIYNETN